MTTTVDGGSGRAAVRRVELDVSGMTCAACASRVQTRLNKVDGVRASVNYATRVATVDAPSAVTSDELCDVVARAGYQAEVRTPGADERPDPDDAVARSLLIRLAVAAVLFVPLSHLSVMFAVLPSTRFTGVAVDSHRAGVADRHLGGVAVPPGGVTQRAPWHGLDGNPDLGRDHRGHAVVAVHDLRPHIRSAGPQGVWQALMGSDAIYLEVAAGVTVFVLAGRYFEARAKSKAGSALRALAALSAKNVTVLLADGTEMVIPAEQLKEQQRFVVRPGGDDRRRRSGGRGRRRCRYECDDG